MSSETRPAAAPVTFGEACSRFARWCAEKPWQAGLLAACVATWAGFYFFVPIWVVGTQTTLRWALNAWTPSGEQFYGCFVLPVSIYLAWHHRARLCAAPKAGSMWGLACVAFGVAVFVIGARCLQPRAALLALPFLFYGVALYLWGWRVARSVLFPCVFLLFMVPVAALEQATFRLQFVITGMIEFLSRLVGVKVQAIGTTLTARDGSFNFEIAEGCSGVRSLAAMSMITAIYVHLTQRELWKKIVVFGASLLFAIVGNVGRLFTVILFAKFIDPEIASGLYHDYSGFFFFPIALMAMTGFSRLVNLDWRKAIDSAMTPEAPVAQTPAKPAEKPPGSVSSYDY